MHEPNNGVSPVQQQARALADPTRYRIFRHVIDASEPPRVASISRHFGLSESAVRQHLGKLCDAGLVLEEQAVRKGPGRPPLQYRLGARWTGDWRSPSPYQELAILFLRVLQTGGSPRDVGMAAGRALAEESEAGQGSLDFLEAEMAGRGFDPHRMEHGDHTDLVLGNCPYQAAAVADRDVVCGLHRGLAEGMATAGEADIEVTGLVVVDPEQAGCRLRTRRKAS